MLKRVVLVVTIWVAISLPSFAADVSIFVIGPSAEVAPTGQFYAMCQAKANGSILVGFDVLLNYADNASQKQAAIEARAIQVLSEIGVTVGGGDKKTVFGGPNN